MQEQAYLVERFRIEHVGRLIMDEKWYDVDIHFRQVLIPH